METIGFTKSEGISMVEKDGDNELSISTTGLTHEDLNPQEGNQLQQLAECLSPEDNVRIFLDKFCSFIKHIRSQLSPHANKLDLATDTNLVNLQGTLAVVMRTYMNHPEDVELNMANAEEAVGQIQNSLQALHKTHPTTYRGVVKYINGSPAMKGCDNSKTKKLLKQLFIGKNPKTALASLKDFTGIQAECVQEANGQQRSSNTHSYAILAAVLGGVGIVAIGVGVAIACTGVGGPVGCGASIAGATLLLLAGAIVCGGGIAAGVMCGRAMKQAKKEDTTEEHREGEREELKITEAHEIPHPHDDPLTRRVGKIQDSAMIGSFSSTGTSVPSCRSYNPHNWPVVLDHCE